MLYNNNDNYNKNNSQSNGNTDNDNTNFYLESGLIKAFLDDLTKVKLDTNKYNQLIEKTKSGLSNSENNSNNYYNYELDLDFSFKPKIIDDRKYYYRAFQYRGIGLFKKEDIPWLKVSLNDLSLETLKGLLQFSVEEREYIAKQAYGKIFEEVTSVIYHSSIASVLKVKFIDGTDYDLIYSKSEDTNREELIKKDFENKKEIINQILREQEKYVELKNQSQINKRRNKNDNNGDNNKDNNNNFENTEDTNKNNKKKISEITIYKYSKKGKGKLYEAIIVYGKPYFLSINDNSINGNYKAEIRDKIGESSRILIPPQYDEYPYEPYEFENIYEIQNYIERAKKENHDSLFKKINAIVTKYNDQEKHKTILLSIDVFHSYFQDRFSTVHYDLIVGGNGSGKTSLGDTYGAIAYRAIVMTDPTAPNLFRLLGKVEPAQCTIILEEAERIDLSQDLMNVLKTGYAYNGKVPRINTNTNKQEFFYSFCQKIIIAERTPNPTVAKGVMDRTYPIHCYKGISKYDIKEILNPTETGGSEHKQLLEEINDLRKLMLIYRLIHFKDAIPDVDIGIYGRDKELTKPSIQLFNSTESQKDVIETLQKFSDIKNDRKEATIEFAILPIIINLISRYGLQFASSTYWQSIIENIPGKEDEKKPNEYHTEDHGTLHRTTITKILTDVYGVKTKHTKNGNILIFDPEIINRIKKTYNTKIQINNNNKSRDYKNKDNSNSNNKENQLNKENSSFEKEKDEQIIHNEDDHISFLKNEKVDDDDDNINEINTVTDKLDEGEGGE